MGSSYNERTVGYQKLLLWRIRPEWRDPNCINPSCTQDHQFMQDYLHKSELAIQWWDLSAEFFEFRDGEILDVRVVVEDEVEDPINKSSSGRALYNWARSGNIMEQFTGYAGPLGGAPGPTFKGEVIFVGNNPLDKHQTGSMSWKKYIYIGETNTRETSFITRRDINGVAELHVLLKIDLPLGWWLHYPNIFPETMEITLKSNEVLPDNMPDGFDPSTEVTGHAVRWDLCTANGAYRDNNAIPDDLSVSRMMELFMLHPLYPFCGTFYYMKLVVTDNATTQDGVITQENPLRVSAPVLFVSSRDHKLGAEKSQNRLDYAVSVATHNDVDDYEAMRFYSGNHVTSEPDPLKRGFGKWWAGGKTVKQMKETKEWYGYEEYIQSGGFEIVEISGVDECVTIIQTVPGTGFPAVPVQSAADVVVIHGHGAIIKSDPDKPDVAGKEAYPHTDRSNHKYRPYYLPSSIPGNDSCTWRANKERFLGTLLQGSFKDTLYSGYGCNGEYDLHPDFGVAPAYLPAHAWWENFWLKQFSENKETRWLVLVSCTNLSGEGSPTERPDKNWQAVIEAGYLQSVCGFSMTTKAKQGFLIGSQNMLTRYADYLRGFVISHGYTPEADVSHDEYRWHSYTQDPSIAAWMEAAWETILYNLDQEFIDYTQVHSAAAIDDTHKWFLDDIVQLDDEHYDISKMVISRDNLN